MCLKTICTFIFLHSTKEVLKKHPLHSGKSFIIVYFPWVLRENEMVVVTEPGDYRQVRPSTCLATFLCQSRDGERSGLEPPRWMHSTPITGTASQLRVGKNISVWYNRQQSLLHCLLVSYEFINKNLGKWSAEIFDKTTVRSVSTSGLLQVWVKAVGGLKARRDIYRVWLAG